MMTPLLALLVAAQAGASHDNGLGTLDGLELSELITVYASSPRWRLSFHPRATIYEDNLQERQFPAARRRRDGNRAIFETRSADGARVQVVIRSEPCPFAGTRGYLSATVSVFGETRNGCAGLIHRDMPVSTIVYRDFPLDRGISAYGSDWSLSIDRRGGAYFMQDNPGDSNRPAGISMQLDASPDINRRRARFSMRAPDGRTAVATIKARPCVTAFGRATPLTLRFSFGGVERTGCADNAAPPPQSVYNPGR